MMSFASITDKIIIFLCCLFIYFFQADFDISIIIILVSIIFSGFLSYFDDERLKTVLTAGFSILCCFVPSLVLFLPLIAFDMLFYKYQYINLFVIIPLVSFFQAASLQTFSTAVIMMILSISLRYRLEAQTKLHTKHNELGDAKREMSIQLEKQNRDLIEKQDDELYHATLNERTRIAREIHDNVGHLLSSAILQSGAILTINQDEKLRLHLKALNDTLNQAMNSIRTSVHELYDESVDLDAQIRKAIKQFTFCEISYDYNINSNPGKKLKYAFISIVNEAFANMIKHSNATHASITFREHPALYQLIIKDNGMVKNYSLDEGLGLKNMIDRVHSFDGNINIMTENGFKIFISIPKEGQHEDTYCG